MGKALSQPVISDDFASLFKEQAVESSVFAGFTAGVKNLSAVSFTFAIRKARTLSAQWYKDGRWHDANRLDGLIAQAMFERRTS